MEMAAAGIGVMTSRRNGNVKPRLRGYLLLYYTFMLYKTGRRTVNGDFNLLEVLIFLIAIYFILSRAFYFKCGSFRGFSLIHPDNGHRATNFLDSNLSQIEWLWMNRIATMPR